jgi:hypothetical protein
LEASGDAIGHVLHAAMSPSGDQWLMYAEGKVRLFVGWKGEAKLIATVRLAADLTSTLDQL